MYSPTSRVLTVLELLQSRKQLSGAELARRLEVDVRTARRYITTLQDMGIPIETERGPYGGYQLRRGYKLPPLMFTDAEAVALTLGLLAIREYRFPVDMIAVEGALAKTERALPEKLFDQVRGLQEAITFNVSNSSEPFDNEFVATLSAAAHQERQVRLSYQSWRGDETKRIFDPYGIVFNEGYWYTAGYCHLRQDLRTFRLDRIMALELLESTFTRPVDFDTLDYVLASLISWPGTEQIEVLLETTVEHAERIIAPAVGTLEPADNGVIFRRAANQLDWVAHVLISLDCPVHIIQTEELRQIIRHMGRKALQIAGEEVQRERER